MANIILLPDDETPLSGKQRMLNRVSSVSPQTPRPMHVPGVIDITSSPEDLKPPGRERPSQAEVIDVEDSDDEVNQEKLTKQWHLRAPLHFKSKVVRSLDREGEVERRKVRKRLCNENDHQLKEVESTETKVQVHHGLNNEKIRFSCEQLCVLEAVSRGQSVFVTGSAGTGKSHILEYAIKVMTRLHGASGVYVTASTGIAACAIGGTTIHSFAGVGIGALEKEKLVGMVMRSREKRMKWMNARALVIDEISMVDAQLFDKIDFVGRRLKNCDKPFGGLQLLVTGDFFQLPPVQGWGAAKVFSFNAKCWDECFDLQIELRHVFRQSDKEFIDMLNQVRLGKCTYQTEQRLKACEGTPSGLGLQPTRLFPRREDVDRVNVEQLTTLKQGGKETVTYFAKDSGNVDQLKGNRAEAEVTLVQGAQVMLIKNLDTGGGLVNGARGVLVRFVQPVEGAHGETDVKVSKGGGWPVVRFDCEGGHERVIRPESWSVMEGEAEVAKRIQIPLILAWALSIHKCQGMTLESVETDLTRSFEYGMVYVALSRVKSLNGLRLLGFDARKIKVHPQVVAFYQNLTESKQSLEADERSLYPFLGEVFRL